uniref:Uncharacterized protein MANES_08G059000 n=1 Tax=Rhizophora mucronata TaxID=61149 RepID=A0A2P2M631_RHIMU
MNPISFPWFYHKNNMLIKSKENCGYRIFHLLAIASQILEIHQAALSG